MKNPKYIHLAVGDHFVKCGQHYGDNYVVLKKNHLGEDVVSDDPNGGTCVVCGKSAFEIDCLPKD